MRKQGYRESTTHFSVKSLKWVARRTNLLEPEQAKTILASANVSESRKRKLVEDLERFYKYKHISFDKPRYKKPDKLPFIPTEQEIDALIAGSGKKLTTMLQLLKEPGIPRIHLPYLVTSKRVSGPVTVVDRTGANDDSDNHSGIPYTTIRLNPCYIPPHLPCSVAPTKQQ